jgi:hypothetical protein
MELNLADKAKINYALSMLRDSIIFGNSDTLMTVDEIEDLILKIWSK